nr:uncharacterized protein C17orf112 homolog [Microcebus murinus]
MAEPTPAPYSAFRSFGQINHDSPVNQLQSVQNMSLVTSVIVTEIFLRNSKRQPSSFFRDEFALGKIFPEYRINFFWKFQTTLSMASSLDLDPDPPYFSISVLLFIFLKE